MFVNFDPPNGNINLSDVITTGGKKQRQLVNGISILNLGFSPRHQIDPHEANNPLTQTRHHILHVGI